MRINPIRPTVNMKRNSAIKSLKKGLTFTGMALYALKYAIKDAFREKYYVKIDGKLIDENDLPHSISRHDDWIGAKWGQLVFSPKDEEKMKHMSSKERSDYMTLLIRQKKYTKTDQLTFDPDIIKKYCSH